MLRCDYDAAVAKFNEMKMKKEIAYIVVTIVPKADTRLLSNILRKKMDYIVSYLWRNHSTNMDKYTDINTVIFSSMILKYFQFEDKMCKKWECIVEKEVRKVNRNYVQEFVDDILSNYGDRPCWPILEWKNKFLFISWMPYGSKAREKMVYATCKEGLVSELAGLHRKMNATDEGELSVSYILGI